MSGDATRRKEIIMLSRKNVKESESNGRPLKGRIPMVHWKRMLLEDEGWRIPIAEVLSQSRLNDGFGDDVLEGVVSVPGEMMRVPFALVVVCF